MRSPARWILIGLLVAGAGLAWGLIPRSEQYSDFGGFSDEGMVDVECGSAFNEDVDPYFHDWEEGEVYRADLRSGYDPPIFEAQTATQVCEDLISGPRTVAITGLAGGALLVLVGIVGAAGSNGTAAVASSDDSVPPPPPGSSPPPPPAPPPAPPAGSPPPTPTTSESTPTARLVFGDGRHVDLVDQVVLGRDPAPPTDSASTTVIAVSDATVSKTHLRVGVTGADVWIEDLHSRNGVSIVAPTGATTTATPGQRVILDVGDRVIVGDSTTFIVTDRSSTHSGRIE